MHRAAIDEGDGGEEENVAVLVFELPVGEVNLTIAEITQDDDLRAEVVRADDADDLEVARSGDRPGDGRGRPKVGGRRKGGEGGGRLEIAVVPKEDRPRHAGGDKNIQQQESDESAAIHALFLLQVEEMFGQYADVKMAFFICPATRRRAEQNARAQMGFLRAGT